MAASAFLAFPHALNRGSHIRIELFLGFMGRFRILGEAISIGIGAIIAGWFAYHACTMVVWSYQFGDISTGLDATPLWIPQSTMAFGSVLFAIAIADQWLQLMLAGKHTIPASEGGD
jgi:TRAP-type C4-dicarboxylate transport system permease small subunit